MEGEREKTRQIYSGKEEKGGGQRRWRLQGEEQVGIIIEEQEGRKHKHSQLTNTVSVYL